MSEMVERIAEAMAKEHGYPEQTEWPQDWNDVSGPGLPTAADLWRSYARVALKAMRGSTDEMDEAAAVVRIDTHTGRHTFVDMAEASEIWTAMLDAALQEATHDVR